MIRRGQQPAQEESFFEFEILFSFSGGGWGVEGGACYCRSCSSLLADVLFCYQLGRNPILVVHVCQPLFLLQPEHTQLKKEKEEGKRAFDVNRIAADQTIYMPPPPPLPNSYSQHRAVYGNCRLLLYVVQKYSAAAVGPDNRRKESYKCLTAILSFSFSFGTEVNLGFPSFCDISAQKMANIT